jgi:hypothetical protein
MEMELRVFNRGRFGKSHWACPACPVAQLDGTGVAQLDGTGVALVDGMGG